jgi:predicted RNA binding protein YcfA (HicA-like mRNA interferase family)
MGKFPVDADKARVFRALAALGFDVIRERVREHNALRRSNPDGTATPMTIPNDPHLKAATLRAICRQAGIERDETSLPRTSRVERGGVPAQ